MLNQSTVVLMPSRHEGLPLVAVEAAMMARPVVATAVAGIPEVVLDGRTGLIVENGPEPMARAIARAHALGRFTLESCADGYDALYRRMRPGGAG